MRIFMPPGIALLGWVAAAAPAGAAVLQDDFNDNTRAAPWSQVEDDASKLIVTETSARLEARSTGTGATSLDAIYLSDGPAGFTISALSDFSFKIDYAFNAAT